MASAIIEAFAECYTVSQLDEMLKGALADLANGVRVTSIQLEGGGGSGRTIDQDTERMVQILRAAKRMRAAEDAAAGTGAKFAQEPPMAAAVNFGTRRART